MEGQVAFSFPFFFNIVKETAKKKNPFLLFRRWCRGSSSGGDPAVWSRGPPRGPPPPYLDPPDSVADAAYFLRHLVRSGGVVGI